MRTRLSRTKLLAIGCACLLVQGVLGSFDPRDPVADILAESLEYSWTGDDGDDAQFCLQADSQQKQQQQPWMAKLAPLEALESAFDRAGNGRIKAYIKDKINTNTLANCKNTLHVLTEPLEEDKAEMPRLMRLLEMGLLAFHHVAESTPEKTKPLLMPVISRTELLQRQLVDLFKCQDKLSPNEAMYRRSCAAVGIFYEDYMEQLRRVVGHANSGFRESQLVQEAFSTLKFQTEGVYLTQRGAHQAIDALEASDSMDSMKALVALMRMTLASGDALQACQISLQKSVLKKDARSGSVSDLEQLIYSHLSMSGRHRDPSFVGSSSPPPPMGSKERAAARCQGTLTETLDTVETTLSIPLGRGGNVLVENGSLFLHRVLTKDIDRIGEWIQETWKSSHQQHGGGAQKGEWRQLEMVVALLVKNLKDVELLSDQAETIVREFLGHVRQLEGKIHELDACVLSVERQRGGGEEGRERDEEGEAEEAEGSDDDDEKRTGRPMLLTCRYLAERSRETMMVAFGGATLARLLGLGEEVDKALRVVARSVGLWDDVVENISRKKVVSGGEWDMISIVDTKEALDGLGRAYVNKVVAADTESEEGLGELVPLVIAQIRSLQACANVQRAISLSSSSSSTSA
ncbi:hypothetical protein BGX23_006171 [Mortierella sp. AD031]|nr:hypothetical protein BGX23_006171 [Mortierella sp. AD031]